MSGFWQDPYVAGISLTYDGTREEHLQHVLPLLDALQIKATFFAYPPNLIGNLKDWKQAAANGHEIGNAFMYGATDPDGLVPHWPAQTLQTEFEESQELIKTLDPNGSFAYPAVRTIWSSEGLPIVDEVVNKTIVKVNEEMLSPFATQFQNARSPINGFNNPNDINPRAIKSIDADELDAEGLCVLAHVGISQQAWTVFVFNGLADSDFDAEAHERFVKWLAERKAAVMITAFREIARLLPYSEHVKSN
ncbi:MAG TPA: polysaccharide deacetylase family protein [Fimbriimonadaceae bacterium]|jgi:sialate O-acetylesterase